jgi:hypothetical protein
MVVLPRLARALNAPVIAALLGLVLIAVAIAGLATDDIRRGYAIIILVVGVIDLLRSFPVRSCRQPRVFAGACGFGARC